MNNKQTLAAINAQICAARLLTQDLVEALCQAEDHSNGQHMGKASEQVNGAVGALLPTLDQVEAIRQQIASVMSLAKLAR